MTVIKLKNDNTARHSGNMPYFSEIFNDLFDNMLTTDFRRGTTPPVNILEHDDDYVLELAAPGLKKEDFKIRIDKDLMRIDAEKKDEKNETSQKYSRREFNYVSFSRSFNLPEMVDTDHIRANYHNGVMSITLPKKAEAKPKEPKVIEVA